MRKIGEFEVIDHGIEHSQYFQGCGVAYTPFKYAVTGIGDNPAEAIDDCLEQMAQAGLETEDMEARIMAQEGWEAWPTEPYAQPNEDIYYHVSIRYNKELTL